MKLIRALLCKFIDEIMGVTPARDLGPGKTDSNVGKPSRKKVAPQECVGSLTRYRSKVKTGLVRKDIRSSGSDNLQQGKEDEFTNSD
jgi:hypothetical protein